MRRRSIVPALAVALSAATAATFPPAPVSAASVPSGFADAKVADVARPTAVEWLPSDQIVVLEQGGRVRVARPGEAFTTTLTLSGVCSNGERGLLGFTHDPAFLHNGLVYLYYTRQAPGAPGGCVNRVSRFTMSGATIERASEVVLLDNISSVAGNHNGGDLDFGSDGYLYVSVGDGGRDPRGNSGSGGNNDAAQDRSLLNGKILRITRDGAPAPGNPLSGPNTVACGSRGNTPSTPTTECREIFAWGLRNPFRIAFDRNDGSNRFFINDVGQSTREEVTPGLPGNHGWPIYEGSCPQGQTSCGAMPSNLIAPVTEYGHNRGTVITAGAFTPNGLWPVQYDGTYLFGDAGSGQIWVRQPNGAVDYDRPFATGAHGLADMTFGFDAAGRMVLYYTRSQGELRVITPTGAPAAGTASNLRMLPITPIRAYDTGDGTGVAAGHVFNGTTRRIDLDPPGDYEAALVNVTIDATQGAGWVRTWGTRARRPATSTINADAPGSIVANAAIVPLDADGSFVIESSMTTRLVVDVMAWFDDTGGTVSAGRFVALPPARLADTRIPAGRALTSGSPNPWTRTSSQIDVDVAGHLGVPADGTAAAAVLAVAAIARPDAAGWIAGFPRGATWSGTSNVNVVAGDIRANVLVVPLGADGGVSLRTLDIADAAIDVVGYVTSPSAPVDGAGLYSAIEPARLVDTRTGHGFGRLGAHTPATVTMPSGGLGSVSGVVQNVTATATSAPGWIATYPATGTVPFVSNVNFMGPFQTRAALAFTRVPPSRAAGYVASVPTDVVVDVVGVFSG